MFRGLDQGACVLGGQREVRMEGRVKASWYWAECLDICLWTLGHMETRTGLSG